MPLGAANLSGAGLDQGWSLHGARRHMPTGGRLVELACWSGQLTAWGLAGS
jgi:hypothetical protein